MEAADAGNDLSVREQEFKQHLLELGLLTEITPPLQPQNARPRSEPVAAVGIHVSELVIKERR